MKEIVRFWELKRNRLKTANLGVFGALGVCSLRCVIWREIALK
jgi:hypothetical protein